MKQLRLAFLAIGIVLLVFLIWKLGAREILTLLQAIGWHILPLALIYGLYQLVRAAALGRCLIEDTGDSLWKIFSIRVAGEAVQYLTFTGPFLAEPAKAWLLKGRGLSTEGAFAATITEYLSYTFTSAAFTAWALTFMLSHYPLRGPVAGVARGLLFFMLLFLAVAAFAIWRRVYLIGAALQAFTRIPFRRRMGGLDMARVRHMEDLLLHVFRERPRRFMSILGLQIFAQLLLSLEIFWILRAMNLAIPAAVPFVIEGAGKFISLAFFFVPTQVGAAEGTYAVIFRSLELAAPAGIALSLIRRLRSLLVAAAGLAALWLLQR